MDELKTFGYTMVMIMLYAFTYAIIEWLSNGSAPTDAGRDLLLVVILVSCLRHRNINRSSFDSLPRIRL